MTIVVVTSSVVGMIVVVAAAVAVDKMPESTANITSDSVSETGSKQCNIFGVIYVRL